MVSYSIDIRCRIFSIHWHQSTRRHVTCFQQDIHPRCSIGHLLACHFHIIERIRLGRQDIQNRRTRRYHHTCRTAHSTRDYLCQHRWQTTNGPQRQFLAGFDKIRQLGSRLRHISFYAGMEMSGIHVKDMDNPKRNYPRAVFIGSLITVLIFVLGTYSLGFIIPQKDINLTQSLLTGFDNYFKYVRMSWMSPVIAVVLAFGVLAGVLTWVAGPSKGIFTVGKAGYLPKFMQKTNKIGVQRNILIIQGCIVTILSLLFVVMPSVQSFYQILSQLTVLLYLIMYLLMFASVIYLRYSMKDAERPFRIGKTATS